MECEATARVVVLKVATAEALRVTVPSVVVPSLKVTVPVGVPDTEAVTVTVRVTVPPGKAGLGKALKAVVVFCWTVCVSGAEVLAASFVSPPYAAVMECCPGGRDKVVNVATPEALSVPVPIIVAPSLKMTDPVGMPEKAGVTITVKVTGTPDSEGLEPDASDVAVLSWTVSVEVADVRLLLVAVSV